ncbi:MAG: hypothetical protein GY806_15425 [Gammaproteobacteria bacterium]|nr:hypothetical protein [Gammaproteobacteria bacterium]
MKPDLRTATNDDAAGTKKITFCGIEHRIRVDLTSGDASIVIHPADDDGDSYA